MQSPRGYPMHLMHATKQINKNNHTRAYTCPHTHA